MVLLNLGKGKGWDHPVHMHGHSFWVVKVGFSTYNDSGFLLSDNQDIDCRGSTQRSALACSCTLMLQPPVAATFYSRHVLFQAHHVNG